MSSWDSIEEGETISVDGVQLKTKYRYMWDTPSGIELNILLFPDQLAKLGIYVYDEDESVDLKSYGKEFNHEEIGDWTSSDIHDYFHPRPPTITKKAIIRRLRSEGIGFTLDRKAWILSQIEAGNLDEVAKISPDIKRTIKLFKARRAATETEEENQLKTTLRRLVGSL